MMRSRLMIFAAALAGVVWLAPLSEAYDQARLERVVDEAVSWLVRNQRKNGSWGGHESARPWEIMADVPGSHRAFRVATTALCVIGLMDSPSRAPETAGAIDRGIDFLLEKFDVKRPNGTELYNVWSFGFTLHCFGQRLLSRPDDPRADAMRAACRRLIEKLAIYQQLDGGWGYYDFNARTFRPSYTSMSFTTATVLIGLDRARRIGIPIPERSLERAIGSVRRARTPMNTFLYGDYMKYMPRHPINQDKGAACRTPLCHHVLELFGESVSLEVKRNALEDLLVRHTRFQKIASRRPIPHEAWYSISGYFYLYGHAYAAYVLEELPEADQERLWPAMLEALLYCRQPDGSFWDYPLYSYHKEYGTAFALMALSRVPRE